MKLDNFGKIKEGDAAGWLLSLFLDKLTKDRDELSDKTDQIQMCISSLDFRVCPGRESLQQSYSPSCRQSN